LEEGVCKMEDKELDKRIKEALLEGSAESLELKEKIWQNIKSETIGKNKGVVKVLPARKKKPDWFKITAVAAGISLIFAFGTESGQAAVTKLKELLVPEKVIVEELEGQKEENKVSLQESKAGYTIYLDEERYTMETSNGKDKIVPKLKPTGDYPEIYMEIEQILGKKPAEVAQETENKLQEKFQTVENRGQTEEPILALQVTAKTGIKWNDTLVNYYFIDNTKGGTFVVKQQYFIEAEEGHGARFYHMLKEFRINAE